MNEYAIIAKTIVLFFITVIGLAANLSIIIIIVKNKLLRLQATNLFVLNMAVTDFLTLLVIPVLFYFKQKVIYRLYWLGKYPCKLTPFFIVAFFLSGSLSLMVISINRMCGVVFPNVSWLQLTRRKVVVTLLGVWIVSLATASPTIYYRRYWERQWQDMCEVNCDDGVNKKETGVTVDQVCNYYYGFHIYWISLLAVNVWVPTFVMLTSYIVIFCKIRQSIKLFPQLSEQSRAFRHRHRVIQMLFILFIIQVVCWAPWQLYSVLDATVWFYDPENEVCLGQNSTSICTDHFYDDKNCLGYYWNEISPILHDMKFFFIFANSTINPIIYGYCNEKMRKAFRITFTCFFRGKSNYILQRGAAGSSPFSFIKQNNTATSKIGKSIFKIGEALMVPVNANGKRMAHPKSRRSRVGQLTKRVVIKTTDSFKKGKQSPGLTMKKHNIGYSTDDEFSQSLTTIGQTMLASFQTSSKKVSFADLLIDGTQSDGEYQLKRVASDKVKPIIKKKPRRFFQGKKRFSDTDGHVDNSKWKRSLKMRTVQNTSVQVSSTSTSGTSMDISVNYEFDIQLNVRVLESPNPVVCHKTRPQFERRFSDPGPIGEFEIS